jgi:hypothetical protein
MQVLNNHVLNSYTHFCGRTPSNIYTNNETGHKKKLSKSSDRLHKEKLLLLLGGSDQNARALN